MSLDRAQKREHVKQGLLKLIRDSANGGRLPSERELSERFEVARETLRRCLRELEADGMLERKQGAGTFVSGHPVVKQLQLMSFSEDMLERGFSPSSEVLGVQAVAAGAKLAQKMKVKPGSRLVELRRLRLADDEPMAIETVYLVEASVPGLDAKALRSGSLYELLREKYGLEARSANQQVQATVLNEEEADMLDVPAFSPSLLVERITLSARGEVVEYAKSLYRADRYRFEVNVSRVATVASPVDTIADRRE